MKILNTGNNMLLRMDLVRVLGRSLPRSGRDIAKILNSGFCSKTAVLSAIKEVAGDLAIGTRALSKEYGTTTFVLGGGIFDDKRIFQSFVSHAKMCHPEAVLIKAKLGNKAGAFGAAAYFMRARGITLKEGQGLIGIDIGASKIRLLALDHDGNEVCEVNELIPKNPTPEKLSELLIEQIIYLRLLCIGKKILGIGIGVPGIIENGIIAKASFIGNRPLDLQSEISQKLRKKNIVLPSDKGGDISAIPVLVINDAESACWGERTFGSGKDMDRFIMLTFGSGLGGALSQAGGEIINIEPGEREFDGINYGGFGTVKGIKNINEKFEFHVSTTALLRRLTEKLRAS